MLKLSRPAAEVFIPDGTSWEAACARVTHLVVAAHADDVEIMAWHAILQAGGLAAVIVTDGQGSNTRLLEQKRAASRGNYAAVIWLDHAACCARARAGGRREHPAPPLSRGPGCCARRG
jgi:hypothetical protein